MLGEVLGSPEKRTVNPANLLQMRLISVLGLGGYGSWILANPGPESTEFAANSLSLPSLLLPAEFGLWAGPGC